MVITLKRGSHSKRQEPANEFRQAGINLASWLNAPEDNPTKIKFGRMITTMNELSLATRNERIRAGYSTRRDWEDLAKTLQAQATATRRVFSRVRVGINPWGKEPIFVSLDDSTESASVGLKGVWSFTWNYRGDSNAGNALRNIVDLAEHGLLERVRRCIVRDCRLWFYAGRTVQECCRPRCREKKYRVTEKGKLARRRIQKCYWERQKQEMKKLGVLPQKGRRRIS